MCPPGWVLLRVLLKRPPASHCTLGSPAQQDGDGNTDDSKLCLHHETNILKSLLMSLEWSEEKHCSTPRIFNFVPFAIFSSPLELVFAFMLHVIYLVACQLVSILQETSTLAAAEMGIKICSPVGVTEGAPTRMRKQRLFVTSKDDLPLLSSRAWLPIRRPRPGGQGGALSSVQTKARQLLAAASGDGRCAAGVAGSEQRAVNGQSGVRARLVCPDTPRPAVQRTVHGVTRSGAHKGPRSGTSSSICWVCVP